MFTRQGRLPAIPNKSQSDCYGRKIRSVKQVTNYGVHGRWLEGELYPCRTDSKGDVAHEVIAT